MRMSSFLGCILLVVANLATQTQAGYYSYNSYNNY